MHSVDGLLLYLLQKLIYRQYPDD